MKPLVIALSLCLALTTATAAQAQTRQLGQTWAEFLQRIDPFLGQLAEMLGDLAGWHTPEILPNGDILIRRRQSLDDSSPEPPSPNGSEPPITEPLEL